MKEIEEGEANLKNKSYQKARVFLWITNLINFIIEKIS